MSSPQTFELTPGTRYRGIEGLGQVLIYTPSNPALYRYNRAVWLVLELALSGLDVADIEAETQGVLGDSPEASATRVRTSLRELTAKGILRATRPAETVDGSERR